MVRKSGIICFLIVLNVYGQTDYTQTIQLHPGWNLVSWHIWPSGTPEVFETIAQMLPDDGPNGDHSWLHYSPGGKVYYYDDDDLWWPDYSSVGNVDWNVDWAFYFEMNGLHNWDEYTNLPEAWSYSEDIVFITSDAWDDYEGQPTNDPYANHWFFLGYSAPGYCKLSSIPNDPPPEQLTNIGDPDLFEYLGPFHWLIWYDSDIPGNPEDFPLYELKIVKDDRGKAYIPDPDRQNHNRKPRDNIGVLEPGKGYFLGFAHQGDYTFEGWAEWPQWREESVSPNPKSNQQVIASSNHFTFTRYTHWSYPVYIDTIDQEQCPMEPGDEIGIFDGDLCVGAEIYNGEFPLLVTCWEDDKATPMELDGYIDGHTMTFIWYDVSENSENEFYLPPMTAAKAEDDRVVPQYAGFGCGLYAYKALMNGIATINYLPQEFRVRQNFPNPFNAETIIPLELPQRSRVRLEIYNVRGQLLGLPFEKTYDAGWPKIHWNASKLPSGVYFYRVTAKGLERGGTSINIGKMLLLK